MPTFPDVPLSDALDVVLSNALDVADEPLPTAGELSARELIAELRHLVPGGDWARAVADMVGTDRRTIQRIAAGTSRGSQRTVEELRRTWTDQRRPIESARRRAVQRVRQTARQRLTTPGGRFTVKGTVRVSNDERPGRKLNLGPQLTHRSRDAIVSRWEKDGAVAAADTMHNAIGADYARGLEILDVEDMTWE